MLRGGRLSCSPRSRNGCRGLPPGPRPPDLLNPRRLSGAAPAPPCTACGMAREGAEAKAGWWGRGLGLHVACQRQAAAWGQRGGGGEAPAT